ncbi:unnamed protein product [Peniophora sp. CBMAI 1063]|nr:unnamed protein product [Peniophora sp. CBMAI 1063]
MGQTKLFVDAVDVAGRVHSTAEIRHNPSQPCSDDTSEKWQNAFDGRHLEDACAGVAVFGRRRYCVVRMLAEAEKPLTKFDSMREMVRAVHDALIAHKVAYEQAHLLHRDVSPSNILITFSGGCLVDWYSTLDRRLTTGCVDDDDDEACTPQRVLSPFASYALWDGMKVTHDLRDDLESFLWVILYMAVRYRPINLDARSTLWYLYTTFNIGLSYTKDKGDTHYDYVGGAKKLDFLRGYRSSFGRKEVYRSLPQPLQFLLVNLSYIFLPLYPPSLRVFLSVRDSTEVVAELHPDLPVDELYGGKVLTGKDIWRLQEEWRRVPGEKSAVDFELPSGTVITFKEESIDYTPVETHAMVQRAILIAAWTETSAWDHDAKAEDQLPRLQAAFVNDAVDDA